MGINYLQDLSMTLLQLHSFYIPPCCSCRVMNKIHIGAGIFVLFNLLYIYHFVQFTFSPLFLVAPRGVEPLSRDPKSRMLDRYNTGLSLKNSRRRELNPREADLQSATLPLRHLGTENNDKNNNLNHRSN